MITSDRKARMMLSCAVDGGDPAVAELVQNLGAEGTWALIGAGMLIVAGNGRGLPFDYDELERWTRVGYERG